MWDYYGSKLLNGYINYASETEKCLICGKEFLPTTGYVYKRVSEEKTVYFCRYNHMREWDRVNDKYFDLRKSLKKLGRKGKKRKDLSVEETMKAIKVLEVQLDYARGEEASRKNPRV